MSSDDNRMCFHMGCGERLQSRRWIVRCVSGALLQREVSPVTDRTEQQPGHEEDRDKS